MIGQQAAGVAGDEHSAGSPGHELLERLVSAGARVERCGDVYRGLALVLGPGRGRGKSWEVVVVRLEDVAPEEMEFFSIVARNRDAPPVLVYSSGGSAADVREAVRAGADGEWSEATAQRWLGRMRSAPKGAGKDGAPALAGRGPADVPEGESLAEKATGADRVGVGGGAASGPGEEVDRRTAAGDEQLRSGEEPVGSGDESGKGETVQRGAARVPWKQYADRPVRRRPPGSDGAAGNDESSGDVAVPKPSGEHRPLLSEEELRELIGDDVAALAPRRQGHDEGNGNGSEEEAS